MARTGLRMMATFPSPSLKFRTAGFPQYSFKASLSDRACPPLPWLSLLPASPPRPTVCRDSSPASAPAPPAWRCVQARAGLRRPLRGRLTPPTPGVLGSGPSSVVSDHHGLLRPQPPVPPARNDFAALPFIRRAFAVWARLGDPRDLPYFRCRALQTCRRPYTGGLGRLSRCACAARYQASSLCPRVATHENPPLPAMPGGEYYFGAASFALCCGPSVCLALLTGSGAMRSRAPHPTF
jgi:hypothetical protein